MNNSCIFCKIINQQLPAKIIYESEDAIVLYDKFPRAQTHVLLISKIHLISLNQAQSMHHNLLGNMMLLVPQIAKQLNLHTGFRTIINTGKGGGQEIDHLHIHILAGPKLPGF